MSKKLESFFNLPPASSYTEDAPVMPTEEQQEVIREIDEAIDKIDEALPTVRDLEASDKEMDELADMAKEHFNNLMELGMSVDSRFSGQIFQTAGNLLGHAITAKQSKLDKKLRMVDLQLKKAALDLKALQATQKSKSAAEEGALEGEGTVLDRNELIRTILGKNTPDSQ